RNWPAFTLALSARSHSAGRRHRLIQSQWSFCGLRGRRSPRNLKSLQHRKRTDLRRSIGLRWNIRKSMTRNCDHGVKKKSRSKRLKEDQGQEQRHEPMLTKKKKTV